MVTLGKESGLDLFAQHLVEQEVIDEQQVKAAVQQAKSENESFILFLEKNNILDGITIAKLASKYFGMPLYDLSAHEPSYIPDEYLELEIVKNHYALPIIKRGDQLLVAVSDPNIPQLQEIGFMTGLKCEFILVEVDKLRGLVDELTGEEEVATEMEDLDDSSLDDLEFDSVDAEGKDEDDSVSAYDIDDRPVVRFVNKILLNAIRTKSSDIHFEPYEKIYRVRYRQDGILYEVANPPIQFTNAIVARLKVMSNLDISERRVPQDGRFKLRISKGQSIDFRVSTCPTLHGEKVVMRILDPGSTKLDVTGLGMNEVQKEHYLRAVNLSQGMILVTGPTGSGKTVSLYSAIRLLNVPEKNISTIEDPVEIYMQGINQVQVNNKTGLTFANALRAFLRQDPDIMMVGEIRDLETAEIAIKAAQTGHLVLSTLHTNSAPVTLSRLLNMGVQAFNIASSVSLVMAQRLVRKLCTKCKKRIEIPKDELLREGFSEEEIPKLELYEPSSCGLCTNGFKGRLGIFEVMPLSIEMGQLIMEGGNSLDLAKQARKEGVASLKESGLQKVKEGQTSLNEVNRVVVD